VGVDLDGDSEGVEIVRHKDRLGKPYSDGPSRTVEGVEITVRQKGHLEKPFSDGPSRTVKGGPQALAWVILVLLVFIRVT
jgi:hypothetical protein